MAAIVEAGLLLKLVLIGLAAGVGVTGMYGTAVRALLRAVELRRAGRAGAATASLGLGLAASLVFAGAIAYGVYLLAAKS